MIKINEKKMEVKQTEKELTASLIIPTLETYS